MTIETKLFGTIEVDENKLISFPQGIVGFPELKDFMLIHDGEGNGSIRWMQSIQEPVLVQGVSIPKRWALTGAATFLALFIAISVSLQTLFIPTMKMTFFGP